MIVWGGFDIFYYTNTGGRYRPAADSWTVTDAADNCPIGRSGFAAVWTGTEMIVWGGSGEFGYLNNGGRYCGQSVPGPTPTPTPTVTPTPAPTSSPPTVRLIVSPVSVNKTGTATFMISASSVAIQPITVNYSMSGNAGLGADYTLSGTPNQATITAGQTTATVTLTVTTTKPRGKEKATMKLGVGLGYQLPTSGKKHKLKPPTATVTIRNK